MNLRNTVKINVFKDYESLEDVFAPEGGWRIQFLRQKKCILQETILLNGFKGTLALNSFID